MGLGDEVMVTGLAKRMQATDPRRVQVFDRKGRPRWHPVWEHNPRIARIGECGNFQILRNGPGLRPYIRAKSPGRWFWETGWSPEPGEIYFSPLERMFGAGRSGFVIVEPNLKTLASPNKAWPCWQQLVDSIDLPWAQMGPVGTPVLNGVRHIVTATFREACAVLAHSLAYVGPEGGLHHAAAAVGLPAVVLFGGYISPQQTGYAMHRNLFTGGQPCGRRGPCDHCTRAMGAITVDWVRDEIEGVLSEGMARPVVA